MLTLTAVFAWYWCESEKKVKVNINDVGKVKVQSLLFALLTFIPMFAINACMKYTGNDYGNYYSYFQNITSGREQEVEIGYKAICLLVSKLGLEFQWVYVIFSLISYSVLLMCVKKYSKNYAVTYLMFFLNGYFALLGLNQIRQFVSVVLIYYAYDYIKERKFGKYCICILIATCFHVTSIVMLPFYWILQKKWKLSMYGAVALILLPFNLFYTEVMTWLFATFMPRYLNTDYTTREFKIDIPYLCMIFVTVFVCLFYRWRETEDRTIFHNCMMMTAIISLFGSWLPEYKRFIYYFFVVSIGYVTELVEKDENKKKKMLIYGIMLLIYAFYYLRTSGEWGVYPYKCI